MQSTAKKKKSRPIRQKLARLFNDIIESWLNDNLSEWRPVGMVTVENVTTPSIQLNTNTNLAQKVNICWYAYLIHSVNIRIFVALSKPPATQVAHTRRRATKTTTLASFFAAGDHGGISLRFLAPENRTPWAIVWFCLRDPV